MKKTVFPHTMTVVSNGANHGLLFASKVTATVAYRALKECKDRVFQQELAIKATDMTALNPGQMKNLVDGLVSPFLEISDDYGTTLLADVREVRSFRVTDCAVEHEGGGELKIAEIAAAVAFEAHVRDDHPELYALRGKQGGSKIWTPGN